MEIRGALEFLWAELSIVMRGLNNMFVRSPLRQLYMMAPSYMGWGGWSDQPIHEVCARISGAPVEFWALHIHECEYLVEHRFNAYFVTFELVVYFGVLATLLFWLVCGCGLYTSLWCMYSRVRNRGHPYVPSPLRIRRGQLQLSIAPPD